MTKAWSVGADLRLQSGEYLVGDESNQEPKLPGFATVNFAAPMRSIIASRCLAKSRTCSTGAITHTEPSRNSTDCRQTLI